MDLGNAPESARHSESSGTDAGRQRILAGDAWIWRTWNFAALGRGDTPPDATESLIKELPRFEEHDWSCMLKERLRQATASDLSRRRRFIASLRHSRPSWRTTSP